MKNKGMKKRKRTLGFTIIEVALVLAITGILFVIVMSSTASRVARRRYFDAINDIAEEIRNAYSATINVENYRRNREDSSFFCSITSAFKGTNLSVNSDVSSSDIITDNLPGRSRCAVYGQVIVFGESSNDSKVDQQSNIYRYDIIGIAKTDNIEPGDGKKNTTSNIMGEEDTSDDVLEMLANGDAGVGANIVTIRNQGNSINLCKAGTAGTYSMYSPQWGARIENKKDRGLYHGVIMIARSPLSGTIHTYFYNYKGASNYETIDTTDSTIYGSGGISKRSYKDNPGDGSFPFYVQNWISAYQGNHSCGNFNKSDGYFIDKAIREGKMVKNGNLDICVGSEDLYALGNKRRAIRIHGDGSTESAVELLTEKDSALVCKDA